MQGWPFATRSIRPRAACSSLRGARQLVPRHRGIDRLKLRKIGGLDDQVDGTRLAGNAADQPAPFQGHDHVVHGRRGDSEKSLEVCLGRRLSVEQGVCVNERQVLTLLCCKWRGGFAGHGIENLIKISMNIRYRVTLTEDERGQLQNLVSGGKGAVRRIKRAQILLAADARSLPSL